MTPEEKARIALTNAIDADPARFVAERSDSSDSIIFKNEDMLVAADAFEEANDPEKAEFIKFISEFSTETWVLPNPERGLILHVQESSSVCSLGGTLASYLSEVSNFDSRQRFRNYAVCVSCIRGLPLHILRNFY